MYGYIGQTDINIYERTIIVTLIARKSVKNAGPRFYKRGLTFDGYVANEIETEQIVTDNTLLSYGLRKSSSYVQLRGSAPFFWSHFTTEKQNLVCAKPPILVNVVDPYHRSAAIHFNRIFKRYGIPIICLNLVKVRAFSINLPSKNGIIRVNCVDCLDRTNVAQYLVGLHAISQQLNILEIVPDSLITDSKIISILRNLYTAHGDALASQNTGSHMAHRMEAYFEKSSVMTDHSRDMYQTLTRYYQNNFQDFEKQSATNLFLGVYVPYLSQEKNIKNIFNDFILHSPWKTRYKMLLNLLVTN
ncbi:hypothetical protein HZS_6856 [Henneguya salminicola]|nr:hypothetical protein HZS_6856 [Henneguya salminicola]